MRLIDTNIILRYLLEDNVKFTVQAVGIIENGSVVILTEVICEVVYVMQKVYKINRDEIVAILSDFLAYPNIDTVDNFSLIREALNLYKNENVDFVDALLCSHHNLSGDEVISFDKRINKILESNS